VCDCDTAAPALSRRSSLIGGAAFGIATLLSTATAARAAVPLPVGPKPDVPLWFRAGRKPSPPGTPGPEAGAGTLPAVPAGAPAVRTLALDNINTGERLSVTYMEHGRYLPDALAEINSLMRDRRSGAVAPIDPGLLDLISDICLRLETRDPVRLISGYRAPATNRAMRAQDRAVARKSYHTRGMAADIVLPGRSLGDLRRAAVALGRGGVGTYPRSGFVHVDVGPPRTWNG
jgi:uncharacterized protein YcbK (DUF882 family)